MTLKEAVDYLQQHPYAEAYPHRDTGTEHLVVLRYTGDPVLQLCDMQDKKMIKIADITDEYAAQDAATDWYITDGLYIGNDNIDARHTYHVIAE